MKFEIEAGEFENALRNIKPYTSSDHTIPVLHNIRVRFTASDVVVDATDRYAVAQYRMPRYDEDGGAGSFLIHKSALGVLLPALRSRKVTTDVVVGDLMTVAGVSVPLAEGEFPAIDRLWPEQLPEPSGPFMLGNGVPKRLGAYRPSGRADSPPFEFFSGDPGKPVVVMRGEGFRVLAQPLTKNPMVGDSAPDRYAGWANVCSG